MADNFSQKHIHLVGTSTSDAETLHLCRQVVSPSPSQIATLLKNQPETIEAGLSAIDCDLIIPSVGEIDLIGISKGRLVLVSTFGELNADLLGRAAGIKQWAYENASILKHLYKIHGLGENFSPRILFLCSEIDASARLLIPLLSDLSLEVYRYKCIESTKARWLIVEKADANETINLPSNNTKIAPRGMSDFQTKASAILTEEEIGEFFTIEKPSAAPATDDETDP